MGFIYNKPLSIEDVFSKFDKDGNGQISAEEKRSAENMAIFTNFKVRKNMTLETFEKENRDVYSQYERLSTRLYNEPKTKVEHWLKNEQSSMEEFQEEELRRLEEMEKELENEKEELESKLQLQKEAKEAGINISPEKLTNWSTIALSTLLFMAIFPSKDGSAIKNYLENP